MSLTEVELPDGEVVDLAETKDWVDDNGTKLHFIDYPTDGPLFVDPEEQEDAFVNVQFGTKEFEHAVQNGEIRPREEITDAWREVRRSVPAEETSVVPDDALDYAVWIAEDGLESVTIYVNESDGYMVVSGEPDDLNLELEGTDDLQEALRTARRLRFEMAP